MGGAFKRVINRRIARSPSFCGAILEGLSSFLRLPSLRLRCIFGARGERESVNLLSLSLGGGRSGCYVMALAEIVFF